MKQHQVVGHFAGQDNFFSRLSLKVGLVHEPLCRHLSQKLPQYVNLVYEPFAEVDPILVSQGLHSREATHRVARVQRVLDRVCRRISLETTGQDGQDGRDGRDGQDGLEGQDGQIPDLEVEASSPHGVSLSFA